MDGASLEANVIRLTSRYRLSCGRLAWKRYVVIGCRECRRVHTTHTKHTHTRAHTLTHTQIDGGGRVSTSRPHWRADPNAAVAVTLFNGPTTA